MTGSPSAQHSVSVAAVIVNNVGEILVTQRRDNGRWEPPGGVLEAAEEILDGLRREVLEETGLTIEPLRLSGVYKNMMRSVVSLVFVARVTGGHITTSDETQCVEWWRPQTVSDRMEPTYAIRVWDGLRDDGPAVRAHDGISVLASMTPRAART